MPKKKTKNGHKTHTINQWKEAISTTMVLLRTKAKFSQATLAKELGTEGTYLSRIENGHVAPRLDKLEQLARIFGLSTTQLLGKIEKQLPN